MDVDCRDLGTGVLGKHQGRAPGATTQVEHLPDPERVGQHPQRATGGLDAAGGLPRCALEQLEERCEILGAHGVKDSRRPPRGKRTSRSISRPQTDRTTESTSGRGVVPVTAGPATAAFGLSRWRSGGPIGLEPDPERTKLDRIDVGDESRRGGRILPLDVRLGRRVAVAPCMPHGLAREVPEDEIGGRQGDEEAEEALSRQRRGHRRNHDQEDHGGQNCSHTRLPRMDAAKPHALSPERRSRGRLRRPGEPPDPRAGTGPVAVRRVHRTRAKPPEPLRRRG